MSQFWKLCYGTGDIGKFLKGENIPNFFDHICIDDMDFSLSIMVFFLEKKFTLISKQELQNFPI